MKKKVKGKPDYMKTERPGGMLFLFFTIIAFSFTVHDLHAGNNWINIQESILPKLPSGPEGSAPFGAYSTYLKYEAGWDKLWPVSNMADVVVRFGGTEPRFVFWRGTSYIPCWATYEGAWFTNEFFERRGGPGSGTTSMVEPMSDKQCRYSKVRVLENSEVRVVIHWRYAPVDLEYTNAYIDDKTRWGDWVDEYYIIYPDAAGIRQATLFSSALNDWIEYQESIVINQPGTKPDDNLNYDAITLSNMKGDIKTYSWTEDGGPGLDNPPKDVCIQQVNFKSEYKPFTIVNPENVTFSSYGGHAPNSHFNFWNHWPVAQIKSDTRVATSAEKPSHSSLSHIKWNPYAEKENSRTWIMMHGMTNEGINRLVPLAKSWLHPAVLKLEGNTFVNDGYDPAQRAYMLTKKDCNNAPILKFILDANNTSPVVNPCFVIKNWGNQQIILKINDRLINKGNNFRYDFRETLEGCDLIVWIRLESTKAIEMSLSAID